MFVLFDFRDGQELWQSQLNFFPVYLVDVGESAEKVD
jgi:hypothetical protein